MPRASVPILAALLAASCAAPGRPASLARADHALFWKPDRSAETLAVGPHGAAWQLGTLDAALHPRLVEAWQRGAAPAVPLHGRDPGAWLRAVEATPSAEGGLRLRAKALAPIPLRLTLLADDGDALRPVAWSESAAWNRHAHFASLEVELPRFHGDTEVVIRVEGGYQAFESRLRLVPAP